MRKCVVILIAIALVFGSAICLTSIAQTALMGAQPAVKHHRSHEQVYPSLRGVYGVPDYKIRGGTNRISRFSKAQRQSRYRKHYDRGYSRIDRQYRHYPSYWQRRAGRMRKYGLTERPTGAVRIRRPDIVDRPEPHYRRRHEPSHGRDRGRGRLHSYRPSRRTGWTHSGRSVVDRRRSTKAGRVR